MTVIALYEVKMPIYIIMSIEYRGFMCDLISTQGLLK